MSPRRWEAQEQLLGRRCRPRRWEASDSTTYGERGANLAGGPIFLVDAVEWVLGLQVAEEGAIVGQVGAITAEGVVLGALDEAVLDRVPVDVVQAGIEAAL